MVDRLRHFGVRFFHVERRRVGLDELGHDVYSEDFGNLDRGMLVREGRNDVDYGLPDSELDRRRGRGSPRDGRIVGTDGRETFGRDGDVDILGRMGGVDGLFSMRSERDVVVGDGRSGDFGRESRGYGLRRVYGDRNVLRDRRGEHVLDSLERDERFIDVLADGRLVGRRVDGEVYASSRGSLVDRVHGNVDRYRVQDSSDDELVRGERLLVVVERINGADGRSPRDHRLVVVGVS